MDRKKLILKEVGRRDYNRAASSFGLRGHYSSRDKTFCLLADTLEYRNWQNLFDDMLTDISDLNFVYVPEFEKRGDSRKRFNANPAKSLPVFLRMAKIQRKVYVEYDSSKESRAFNDKLYFRADRRGRIYCWKLYMGHPENIVNYTTLGHVEPKETTYAVYSKKMHNIYRNS
jgi:hypothetical protein